MKNTARGILILSLAFISLSALSAKDEVLWGSQYMPGNFIVGAAGAIETEITHTDRYNLALYPSAEMVLWKPKIGNVAPFDLGVAAEGRIGVPLGRESVFTTGIDLVGSLHMGFKGFNFTGSEYLDNVDLYARFGVSYDLIKPAENDAIGIVATSGLNYFLDDRLMVGASYTGWGSYEDGYDGVSLQVRYRFGKSSSVSGMGDRWSELGQAVDNLSSAEYISQFYAFFYFAVYSGGHYWASDSYAEGQGTYWHYFDEEDHEGFYMERTLLAREDDGDEWWSLTYIDSEEGVSIEYEFLLSADQKILSLYYRDSEGKIHQQDMVDDRELGYLDEEALYSYEDIKSLSTERESVTVPAGSFENCYVILSDGDSYEDYIWWFTEGNRVPGKLVRFETRDGDDIFTGELDDIIKGRKGDFRLR